MESALWLFFFALFLDFFFSLLPLFFLFGLFFFYQNRSIHMQVFFFALFLQNNAVLLVLCCLSGRHYMHGRPGGLDRCGCVDKNGVVWRDLEW